VEIEFSSEFPEVEATDNKNTERDTALMVEGEIEVIQVANSN
jgi:hypothetical protein